MSQLAVGGDRDQTPDAPARRCDATILNPDADPQGGALVLGGAVTTRRLGWLEGDVNPRTAKRVEVAERDEHSDDHD